MENINIIPLLLGGIVNVGLILGVYVKMRLKINSLEIKVGVMAENWKSIDSDLKSIYRKLNDIALKLENKADRP